jgi:tetratricopeptide (TPR) repeat protein
VRDLVGSTDIARLVEFKDLAELLGKCGDRSKESSGILREHSWGEEDADVLNNLAELLRAQGKYDEAEPLCEQSLAIMRKVCAIHLAASSRDHSRKVLGEDHPSMVTSLNNLSMLLENTGRSEEAYVYGRQALAIATRALGPNHPTTKQLRKNWA